MAAWLIFLWCGLLAGYPAALSADEPPPAEGRTFQEGQIWEVKTGGLLDFEDLASALAPLDVIYLGEEHHNKWHVEAAVKVLQALQARGRRPVVAMEMFGWDGQPALTRYLTDRRQPRDEFLNEVQWQHNWGGAFEDYEPLVALARREGWPVLALNPPRQLVRLVAKQGLSAAMADPEAARWNMQEEALVDDPAYREMIVSPLKQCHGGLPEAAAQRMYEASMFRDEGMAKTIAEAWRRRAAAGPGAEPAPPGPIVSYTGGGHVQYHLPVPKRVLRRTGGAAKQATIYLTAFEPSRQEELRRLLREGVADYLWLTPLSAHGAPRRC